MIIWNKNKELKLNWLVGRELANEIKWFPQLPERLLSAGYLWYSPKDGWQPRSFSWPPAPKHISRQSNLILVEEMIIGSFWIRLQTIKDAFNLQTNLWWAHYLISGKPEKHVTWHVRWSVCLILDSSCFWPSWPMAVPMAHDSCYMLYFVATCESSPPKS